MGNAESSVDSSLSRRSSARSSARRSESPSPSLSRKSNSFRRHNGVRPEQQFRRSKTCRVKNGRGQVRPRAPCLITGLTAHQKALLLKKCNRMDNPALYDMGRRVFEEVFTENRQYLTFIGLSVEENWKKNIQFRMHVQHFVLAICECLRRMRDPHACCDVLRDFGALYAAQGKVPHSYFAKIAFALTNAAREIEEEAIAARERAGSTPSDAPSVSTLSTSGDGNVKVRSEKELLAPGHQGNGRRLTTRHSDTSMYRMHHAKAIPPQPLTPPPSSYSKSNNSPSIMSNSTTTISTANEKVQIGSAAPCPVTGEAWTVFSAFVANQIELGYEIEKVLQYEMSKLGLTAKSFTYENNDIIHNQQTTINVE